MGEAGRPSDFSPDPESHAELVRQLRELPDGEKQELFTLARAAIQPRDQIVDPLDALDDEAYWGRVLAEADEPQDLPPAS
jgi:hypothetical protein